MCLYICVFIHVYTHSWFCGYSEYIFYHYIWLTSHVTIYHVQYNNYALLILPYYSTPTHWLFITSCLTPFSLILVLPSHFLYPTLTWCFVPDLLWCCLPFISNRLFRSLGLITALSSLCVCKLLNFLAPSHTWLAVCSLMIPHSLISLLLSCVPSPSLSIHVLSLHVCSIYYGMFTLHVCHFASDEDSARIESSGPFWLHNTPLARLFG